MYAAYIVDIFIQSGSLYSLMSGELSKSPIGHFDVCTAENQTERAKFPADIWPELNLVVGLSEI